MANSHGHLGNGKSWLCTMGKGWRSIFGKGWRSILTVVFSRGAGRYQVAILPAATLPQRLGGGGFFRSLKFKPLYHCAANRSLAIY